MTVLTHGSVALVDQAERYAAGEPVSDEEISRELNRLLDQASGDQIDVIVLACTHFPLLRDRLKALVPDHVTFLDSGDAIARRTLSLLSEDGQTEPVSVLQPGNLYLSEQSKKTGRLENVARSYGFETVIAVDVDE